MKYWDDIFYIIDLDAKQVLHRYDSYEEAKEAVLDIEKTRTVELVHAIDYR